MNKLFSNLAGRPVGGAMLLLAGLLCLSSAEANPVGGTVSQGAATFNTSGSQFTINQSSANAFINWQSFNIGAGQTTTFNQPSATSVTWNQINDANPSQILGNLNANGYVILQNQNGFAIGGSAVINAHGLVMTTSPTAAPDLSSGGPWSFNALPPTAKIINYGQINISGGGTAYLIASDIENNGTISAPGGKIGLYAGQQVLVSMSPDGRGLSARVTLPQGSVDNEGKLIADAGTIAAQAQFVNQNGLVQANSVQNINGTIELVASDSLNLGANSVISANGGKGTSSGGTVVIKSENNFSDQAGSAIDISGGANGGNGGQVELSAKTMGGIQSRIKAGATTGYRGGQLMIDPTDILLDSAYVDMLNDLISGGLSTIDLQADNNIELSTVWNLADQSAAATLSLTAGNNITLDGGAAIKAGNNWNVSLTAGTQVTSSSQVTAGNAGIYLTDDAYIQARNGKITLMAANEVQVGWEGQETPGLANSGIGYVKTTAGGAIEVNATYGNVNAGSNPNGYLFTGGFAAVDSALGGISTAAGGDVSITAGGDITSFLPSVNDQLGDAGSGAFGSQAGKVTITAGGSVYGHYVEGNGAGTVTAQNGNVGSLTLSYVKDKAGNIVYDSNGRPEIIDANSTFALSLVKGSWNVQAPNGSIYLQEVRNPNGVYNNGGIAASVHRFNYAFNASLSLAAGYAVAITGGSEIPRNDPVPIVLPPTLEVTAGAGGFTLYQNVTLFQSIPPAGSSLPPSGNLNITTLNGGDFSGVNLYSLNETADYVAGLNPNLMMSDSDSPQWNSDNPMIVESARHATSPPEYNNPNPVVINVSGSMNNVDIYTTKATEITVGQDMNNSSFIGENLHPTDVSFIKVAGKINYSPYYSFQNLSQPITPIPYGSDNPINPSRWDTIFYLLVDPTVAANLIIPSDVTTDDLKNYYSYLAGLSKGQIWAFPSDSATASNPGFTYNSTTLRLGFGGPMTSTIRDWMNGWTGISDSSGNKTYNTTTVSGTTYGALQVIRLNASGLPIVQNGHLILDTVTFVGQNIINNLYDASLKTSSDPAPGIQIGGPGQFNITAGSMSLGNSQGIESWGIVGPLISSSAPGDYYNSLGSLTDVGADVNVTVSGDVDMLTSRIVSMYGGEVNVDVAGTLNLGSQEVPPGVNANAYGIYTTGHSDVNVIAGGNIEINGSRIAAFNGGNISVLSKHGSVDIGNGGNTYVTVPLVSSIVLPGFQKVGPQNYYLGYQIYGSGIIATSLPQNIQTPGGNPLPGNITVQTPYGNISSSQAGVLQYALNGSTAGGPTINLIAGTKGVAATPSMGNIDLGSSGVIGGTVNLTAQGNITGLVISRQDSSISTAGNFSGTVLSSGTANVSAGGAISGTIIGVSGVNASGSSITASLLSQNVTADGQSGNTLGSSATATSTATSAAATTSNDNAQQTTGMDNQDDDKKKKKLPQIKKMSRVTVLLSTAAPAH